MWRSGSGFVTRTIEVVALSIRLATPEMAVVTRRVEDSRPKAEFVTLPIAVYALKMEADTMKIISYSGGVIASAA